MFDYTFAHWGTFLIAAVLLNLSPGPDIAFILAQTAKSGQRSGFAAMFGIWSGAFLHVLLAAVGLSAILASSATAFSVVKWVGAGPASAQLFLHGFLIIVVAAFIEPPLVILGARLTGYLSRNPYVAAWMDRGLGALFIGLGIRLALSERS